MATTRRDALQRIQDVAQDKWKTLRIFEEDAPDPKQETREKFLVTFPYPYCNGYLHIGHAFSLSKAEFVVGYKRMKNVQCLFPFGFHCTGMPIQTCANKLAAELRKFGNPPVFPAEVEEVDSIVKEGGAADKSKAKKGKVASKASKQKYQWDILKESGVEESLLPSFADPLAWLNFFPGENVRDLNTFGLKVDWRRSFITTEVNPYYDSFIRWQFNKLRHYNKIKFGKRNAVYSPTDAQPCADHDRASGEGIQPQEYTLIKMRVLRLPNIPNVEAVFGDKPVFLPAATLRPETMYGQTNCWVLPTGKYFAYEMKSGEIYITSKHSALNMAYQDFFENFGECKPLCTFSGADLIGLPLSAPLATYDEIFVLPLLTVSMSKGTGIVTSVPSDAPDDYRGLMDLKEKPALRAKFGVKDEWVMPFEPISIIDTPEFGQLAAVEACTRYKVRSQNDKEALTRAKEEVYRAGFYSGVLLKGELTGRTVMEAKPLIREKLISSGLATSYSEPEGKVISRSGDECVVALCDQWYLEYGEESWRKQVERCLANMNVYAVETRNSFEAVLGWLKEWACSRQFGLGTHLPWDEEWLIESLSDSTIYMAFYTIAHLLQGGVDNLDGHVAGPAGINHADLSDALWDYVMLGEGKPDDVAAVNPDMLRKMRTEFMHWYPVDLRVSGKDLVGNHLTFFLYNHVAIFPEDKWPKAVRVNGHVLLNAEKMSKSTGNFLTLREAMSRYTSDGVRFALADAADNVEDANFAVKTADDAILKLWTLVDFVEETLEHLDSMEKGPLTRFADRAFASQLNLKLRLTEQAYEGMMFREAVKEGFFELINDLGKYREAVGADKSTRTSPTLHRMHCDLFLKFVLYQTAALAPICPHTAEHLWGLIKGPLEKRDGVSRGDSIMHLQWPETEEPDTAILAASDYLNETLSRIRVAILKPTKKRKGKNTGPPPAAPTNVKIFVCKEAPEWQKLVIQYLRDNFDQSAWQSARELAVNGEGTGWTFASDIPKRVTVALPADQKKNKKVMPFLAMVRKDVESLGEVALDRNLKFDETDILRENVDVMRMQLGTFGVTDVVIADGHASSESANAADALPGAPSFVLL